jgi:hypothetical protein
MLPAALTVNVQLGAGAPPLLHSPLQIAPCPSSVVSVTVAPTAKLAVAVLPVETFSPGGFDVTLPPLPVLVSVIAADPVPHAAPQVSVPPHPSGVVPQVLFWAAHVVGTQDALAVTLRPALTVVFSVAEIVAATLACTAEVVAVKLAAFPPEGTVTDGGAVTALLLLASVTTAPFIPAGGFSVIVPVDDPPPTTVLGLIVNDVTETVGIPHCPATPAPPQV